MINENIDRFAVKPTNFVKFPFEFYAENYMVSPSSWTESSFKSSYGVKAAAKKDRAPPELRT